MDRKDLHKAPGQWQLSKFDTATLKNSQTKRPNLNVLHQTPSNKMTQLEHVSFSALKQNNQTQMHFIGHPHTVQHGALD